MITLTNSDCFHQPTLNEFLALGRPAWDDARATLQTLLSSTEPTLRDNQGLRQESLFPMSEVEMVLPMAIGDFTEFHSSMDHVRKCGALIHGAHHTIQKSWTAPIAYHGQASSIVISGTDIRRPKSFKLPSVPFSKSSRPYSGYPINLGRTVTLDFQLQMAAVVGPGNELGHPVDVNDARDHIFGLVLMNGWIARDFQGRDFIPMVPFHGTSFATTISPWIVTLDALEPFACDPPSRAPRESLDGRSPYLPENISISYDIRLEVQYKPAGETDSYVVIQSNFKHLLYTLTQQLAYVTLNGCNTRPGDLIGTGTIDGPPASCGTLLQLMNNGARHKPLQLNGNRRSWR